MTILRRALAALLLSATLASAQDGTPPHAPTDSMLERLVGTWMMFGQVQGDSVTYRLTVQRQLQGRFVSLHMVDVAEPPQYEARVTIGADTTPKRIIVHWLDSFGAAYSVPAGYGTAQGDSLVFTIAYPGSTFRNVITANTDSTWRQTIDAQTPQGWTNFASYRLVRRESPAAYDEPPQLASPNILRSLLQDAVQRLLRTYGEQMHDRSVRVGVELDSLGNILSMRLVQRSGLDAVDAEALSIVAKTRFRPGRRGGVAVQSSVVLPIRFLVPE